MKYFASPKMSKNGRTDLLRSFSTRARKWHFCQTSGKFSETPRIYSYRLVFIFYYKFYKLLKCSQFILSIYRRWSKVLMEDAARRLVAKLGKIKHGKFFKFSPNSAPFWSTYPKKWPFLPRTPRAMVSLSKTSMRFEVWAQKLTRFLSFMEDATRKSLFSRMPP